MNLDDWKAGKLSPDDPWAVEALKRGLIQPRANPYTNPGTTPKETRGFQPDPMAQTVRELPGKLLTQADENLTKNITAYTPRPKESEYGSIRMPRMGDDPTDAGLFVLAGPIAVEQALSKIAAKVLPAKTIQDKLLQAGASKAELETRGVTQFLESRGGRPVFPKEVMKHLEENPYQLKEVVKGVETDARELQKAYNRLSNKYGFETSRWDRANPEIAEYLRAEEKFRSSNSTKFHAYQTPGGENYRELLLTSPEYGVTAKGEKGFITSHWDEPNVVAHMRVNDRTLPSGEKALHVEEWQSDWANKLREEKGKTSSLTVEKTDKGWLVYDGDSEVAGPFPTRADADWLLSDKTGSTPAHPLVGNWQDLMARRTLKEAVDGGYDRLTWTTGAQQQDRYDLSKVVDEVTYFPDKKELHLGSMGSEGYNILSDVEPSKISSIIGKEPASKLLQAKVKNTQLASLTTPNENYQTISGLDLKVGGEWANKLYDESMVNRFNKIGKKYGVQVEKTNIAGDAGSAQWMVFNRDGNNYDIATSEKSASILAKEIGGTYKFGGTVAAVPVHSLKITPEMRQSIGKAKFHPFADLPGPAEKATELWHGIQYPKTFKGFRLEGDPQKWGAVQYSQIDKGSNPAPITFYVKPGQDLETRLAEVMKKFEGGKK